MSPCCHEAGTIVGFFPFQFENAISETLGSAVRVGEEMSDSAGVIASLDRTISPATLLRLCRLRHVFLSHLAPVQETLGLAAAVRQDGYAIDLAGGVERYWTWLRHNNLKFCQDTERRRRNIERAGAPLRVELETTDWRVRARQLIEQKRAQYRQTGVRDVFARADRQRLIDHLGEAGGAFAA